jgi:hypothetical protein
VGAPALPPTRHSKDICSPAGRSPWRLCQRSRSCSKRRPGRLSNCGNKKCCSGEQHLNNILSFEIIHNKLYLLCINGGGGGSRTYGGPYSHKGLQRFTECLPNIRHSTILLSSIFPTAHGYIQRHPPGGQDSAHCIETAPHDSAQDYPDQRSRGTRFQAPFLFLSPAIKG